MTPEEIATAVARAVPSVTASVRSVLGGGHADVDDVVQDALIQLVRALPSFRGESTLATFASRVASRVAFRSQRRERAARAGIVLVDVEEAFDTIEAATPSPDSDASAQRRSRALDDVLGRIPREQAECFARRFVLGWSLEEIGRATGAPTNTVRSRLRLARSSLRRAIARTPSAAVLRDARDAA